MTDTEVRVLSDTETQKQLDSYFALAQRRPALFAPSELLPLCLERDEMLRFVKRTGKPLGIVFDNSPFYLVAADLILPKNGQPFRYCRVIYDNPKGNGSVILPLSLSPEGPPLFGLLRIFRHSSREYSLEFPRGFLENRELGPRENAVKELSEELGVRPDSIRLEYLGISSADTGLASGAVSFYLADLAPEERNGSGSVGHEGISGMKWVSEEELRRMILQGEIRCGMTQTAYLRYCLRRAAAENEGTGNSPSGA